MARGYMYAAGASEEVQYAQREDLSKSQIIALGQSKNGVVREIIARRHDCPMGIMITLTHDSVTDVRAAVAANPGASRTVMEHLAEDKSLVVVEALIHNPSIPQDILEQLAFHRKAEVRSLVARRIDEGNVVSAHASTPIVPELRDRVPRAQVVPFPGVSLAEDVDDTPAVPTRTAPVRGFKPSEAI